MLGGSEMGIRTRITCRPGGFVEPIDLALKYGFVAKVGFIIFLSLRSLLKF